MGEWVRWDTGRAVRMIQTSSGLVKQRRHQGPQGLCVAQAVPTSDWLPASPLHLGPLPHLLHTPTLLSLPVSSQALTSFSLPPLKISLRERTQGRGHIQTPLGSVGPAQAPGASGDSGPALRLPTALIRERKTQRQRAC